MIRDILRHIGDVIAELFKKEETWLIIFFAGLSTWLFVAFFEKIWAAIKTFIDFTWPIWVFFLILPLFVSLWLYVRQVQFKRNIKWIMLELRIPREVKKSPQAMEQVLAAIHSLRNAPGDIREWYWDGEVTRWYALEMVSFGGEVRFFLRVYKGQKSLVQAAFFSYYPDLEVIDAEDYVDLFPKNMEEAYAKKMDIWGTEMVLANEGAFPIKTYEDFEHMEEEKQFDPISTFLEVLGKLRKEETVGIQILIAPASPGWKDKFESTMDELKKPATATVQTGGGGEEEGGTKEMLIARSPGHIEILKKVEENLSKPAFDTLIRFIYLSPKEGFSDTFPRRGLAGAFNQYAALNLNSFRQNHKVGTRTRIWKWPHIFPKVRNEYRKQRLLHNYRIREVPPETWMGRLMTSYLFNWNFGSKRFLMNVKCVATLFHPPTAVVLTAPHIRRVESRRTGPPAGLHIYGEEGEIERFT
ncbi:MAG: hypothetical protein V1696_01555 [Candidatus Jorgensenbacteria bacterium]